MASWKLRAWCYLFFKKCHLGYATLTGIQRVAWALSVIIYTISHYPASLAVSLSLLLPLSLHYLLLLLKDRLNVTSVPSPHSQSQFNVSAWCNTCLSGQLLLPISQLIPSTVRNHVKTQMCMQMSYFPLKLMRLKCIPNITWKYHIRQHRHTPRGKK